MGHRRQADCHSACQQQWLNSMSGYYRQSWELVSWKLGKLFHTERKELRSVSIVNQSFLKGDCRYRHIKRRYRCLFPYLNPCMAPLHSPGTSLLPGFIRNCGRIVLGPSGSAAASFGAHQEVRQHYLGLIRNCSSIIWGSSGTAAASFGFLSHLLQFLSLDKMPNRGERAHSGS